MAEIKLSRGLVAVVDGADLHLLTPFKWSAHPVRRKRGGFYAATKDGNKTVYMHRHLLNARAGEQVDHVNGDGLDNRRTNLRIASKSENSANRMFTPGKTGLRGVVVQCWGDRVRYRATVGRGWSISRGPWRTNPLKAALDYDRMASKRFGEFATLNFPCAARAKGGAA